MYRISYVATPFHEDRRAWLAHLGTRLPAPGVVARSPSEAEFRLALSQLADFSVRYSEPGDDGRFHALVEWLADPEGGPWASVNVRPHASEADRIEFWFEQGWPIAILRISTRVAAYCGPMVLIPDNGTRPLVVVAGMDADAALAAW